jgi:hypothetical protein
MIRARLFQFLDSILQLVHAEPGDAPDRMTIVDKAFQENQPVNVRLTILTALIIAPLWFYNAISPFPDP